MRQASPRDSHGSFHAAGSPVQAIRFLQKSPSAEPCENKVREVRPGSPVKQAPAGVLISLRGLSGDLIGQLDADRNLTIADLKPFVQELSGIPKEFQQLLLGARVMADPEFVADVEGEGPLSMLVLVSHDRVMEQLRCLSLQGNATLKMQVLKSIACLGSTKCAEEIVCAVCKLFEDDAEIVRTAALDAVVKIAKRGDEYAIQAVGECMKKAGTMHLAGQVMRDLAEVGNSHAICAVCSVVQEGDTECCLQALDVLGHIAGRGNKHAIGFLGNCLEADDFEVQMKAAALLGQVIERGNKSGIAVARRRMAHPDRDVRWAATEALGAWHEACG